jgi:ABC-type sugar transport system ATPase subunit
MSDVKQRSETSLMTLNGIGKNYSGVWVLKDASFSVSKGKVTVLMGENGAGKSTLKNIFCGLVPPDAGTIEFDGKEYSRLTTHDARALGIAAVHQELSLFPNLSIAENVFMGLGTLPMRKGVIDRRAMHDDTLKLLSDFFESKVDPDQPLERLSLGERQLVELAKALHRASTMLILDEPTTSLSLPERRRLFNVVKRLRERGYAILYITHFLEEVYELADQIVVLRDGRVVGTGTPHEIDRGHLTSLMVGRELAAVDGELATSQHRASTGLAPEIVLRVEDLADGKLLRGVSFEIRAGEIMGLAGLMGAGRSEVAHAIFGINPSEGTVEIRGRAFQNRTPDRAKARGVALVSEDRRADQVFPGLSVRENLTSTILDSLRATAAFVSPKKQRLRAGRLATEYGVRYPGLEAPMVALSGGNQQKCVIARWLATQPAICILDEPTKGIDVGAKAEVHLLVGRLAAAGLAVLLISSDLPELLALSHRIMVMHKGQIVGELDRDRFDPVTVVRMASAGAVG